MERKSIRVLVVDDMPSMRRIVTVMLKHAGFEDISEAENGRKAYEILLANQSINPFHFVVTDWNMPEMPGIELLRKIRSTEGLSSIKVLMVTAEAKQENLIEAIKAKVSNYIVKPFTQQTMEEKLNKLFPIGG